MPTLYRTNGKVVDLAQPLAVERGALVLGLGNEAADRISATIVRNGTAESLSGATVTAYFVRSDGVTVELSGTVSTNTATVELSAACYNVEGAFSLSIAVNATNFAATVRIIEGIVVRTRTDAVSSGGTVYPGGAEVIAALNAKLSKPATEGTNGQVLTTNGAGGVTWQDAGGAATQLNIGGTVYTLRTGTEGAAGYITFVLES